MNCAIAGGGGGGGGGGRREMNCLGLVVCFCFILLPVNSQLGFLMREFYVVMVAHFYLSL